MTKTKTNKPGRAPSTLLVKAITSIRGNGYELAAGEEGAIPEKSAKSQAAKGECVIIEKPTEGTE